MNHELNLPDLLDVIKNSITESLFKEYNGYLFEIKRRFNAIMSGLAMFQLKYPSLLKFDECSRNEDVLKNNLNSVYGISKLYTDTHIRVLLDTVNLEIVEDVHQKLIKLLQEKKVMEPFKIGNKLTITIDGTEFFTSEDICCDRCCERNRRNGKKSYYHQMLCGSIIHPDIKEVIPLGPEFIVKSDGSIKNDCEINAFKRYLVKLSVKYPDIEFIIIADGLTAKATLIEKIVEQGYNYILVCKPGDHKYLFQHLENITSTMIVHTIDTPKGIREYRWINDVQLNESNSKCRVNFLEYKEYRKNGEEGYHNTWVSDQEINHDNIELLVKLARSRWKIENETFNTLKNKGYNLEHNYGHGYKNLSAICALLMMLSFAIDQIQSMLSPIFKKARERHKTILEHWLAMRFFFQEIPFKDIHSYLKVLANGLTYLYQNDS